MVSDEAGKIKLVTGIMEDAGKEAEKIITQAHAFIEERKRLIDNQITRINKDAEAKANGQAELIRQNIKNSISIEKKRHSLLVMDRIVKMTIDKVKTRMQGLIKTPGYWEILLHWIIEAALGLNVNEAEVNASRDEMPYLTRDLLKKAEHTLFTITGKKILLKKSSQDPLLAQGVVLTAKDGRTAFNNQVPTRILRYQSKIRKIIYTILYKESLFPEENSTV